MFIVPASLAECQTQARSTSCEGLTIMSAGKYETGLMLLAPTAPDLLGGGSAMKPAPQLLSDGSKLLVF